MSNKSYIKRYFLILFILFALSIAYVCNFTKNYPAPITNRISFDAKLKFIRDKINPKDIDTIIVGSSIGMNNVLGSVLEKNSKVVKHAINLSVYEATALEVEQLLELRGAFPNLKRIIYSAQYSDFPHPWRYKDYHPDILREYITHKLSYYRSAKLLFKACNNLVFCYKRAKNWKIKYQQKDKFTSLIFDDSASVPLYIFRQDKVGGRWYLPHPGIMSQKSFDAVGRIAKNAQKEGIKFYLAHQPYRPELYKKHKSVRDAVAYFDNKISKILTKYPNSYLIKLQNLPLNNTQYADRTHLNIKGATIVTKEISKFIDSKEQNKHYIK